VTDAKGAHSRRMNAKGEGIVEIFTRNTIGGCNAQIFLLIRTGRAITPCLLCSWFYTKIETAFPNTAPLVTQPQVSTPSLGSSSSPTLIEASSYPPIYLPRASNTPATPSHFRETPLVMPPIPLRTIQLDASP